MNRNESSASKRKTGLFPIYDCNGRLATGLTFATASGEVLVSLDGAATSAASGDIVEVARGLYYYPPSQAETNVNVHFGVIAMKKATLDLATKTTNCTTKIRAKLFGVAGCDYTMTWVRDDAVSPTTGTLVLTGTDYVFTFKNAVTTVANFETLVTASANLEVQTAGAAHALATVDAFAASNLINGCEGSYTEKITDAFDAISEGSYSFGDAIRLITSVVAGKVLNFSTSTLVFKSLNAAKTRLTGTRDSTGRLTSTVGDLT